MRIATGYYVRLAKGVYVNPVSISLSMPGFARGLPRIEELAPTPDILAEYKRTGDEARYVRRYVKEVLGRLDRTAILRRLERLFPGGEEATLLCYEKDGAFCHRHIARK